MIRETLLVDVDSVSMSCFYCSMNENCSKSFKECRYYNKRLWSQIDKKIRELRQKIFEGIYKEGK